MKNESVSKWGLWSALFVALFSITFSASGLLAFFKVLAFPWDPVITDGASLILAIAFVVMMVSIHHAAPIERNHWSHIGLAFAILYAVLVCIVYFVIMTVVVPNIQRSEMDKVTPFVLDPSGSFMQALDGLGYFFMCLATWFAAPVFAGQGLEKWLRWVFIINSVLGIPILLSATCDFLVEFSQPD